MTLSLLPGSRSARGRAVLALLLVLAAGCGRKGPLFLPQEKVRQAEETLKRQDAPPQAPSTPDGQMAPAPSPQPPR